MITRAHVKTQSSITDALYDTYRLFLRSADTGSDVTPLAYHLVDRAAASIPARGIPAPGVSAGAMNTVVESSIRAAIATVPPAMAAQGEPEVGSGSFVRLRQTVMRWARDEVPLQSVLHLLDRGFDVVAAAVAERAKDPVRLTTDMKLLIDVRAAVTTAVVSVFAATDTDAITASSRQAFTTALLAGRTDVSAARGVGVEAFDRYQVIAISVGPRAHVVGSEQGISGMNPQTRLESAVRKVIDDRALSLVSDAGGTVIAPIVCPDDLVTTDQLHALGEVVGAEITATLVVGPAESIPAMAVQADELLDLAQAIGKPSGVYTLVDLVVEYQLTRPGPAHDRLAALIRPLESNTELLETLRVHMSCGMNRRETARRLSIHPNTVDNRMSRVSATLGIDLTRPQSIAETQSAILAFDTADRRAYRHALPSSA